VVEAPSRRSSKKRRRNFRYRAKPKELDFPTDAGVPETRRHYELRTTLFQIAKLALAEQASIGSAQLVFWNAADPSRSVAPDLFIRLEAPDSLFDSWKTWERGAPEVAVEILSDSDATELAWDGRLHRYHELGVEELIRFDPIAPADCLRVWDRVNEDLVERELEDPMMAESSVLGLHWVVIKDPTLGRMLRLAKDDSGGRLLPTPVEREAKKRKEAEQRVRELEEKLRDK
jgi:Uma2 family endonuclease